MPEPKPETLEECVRDERWNREWDLNFNERGLWDIYDDYGSGDAVVVDAASHIAAAQAALRGQETDHA